MIKVFVSIETRGPDIQTAWADPNLETSLPPQYSTSWQFKFQLNKLSVYPGS